MRGWLAQCRQIDEGQYRHTLHHAAHHCYRQHGISPVSRFDSIAELSQASDHAM